MRIATLSSSTPRSLQAAITVLRQRGLDAMVIEALQESTFQHVLLNLPLMAGAQMEVEVPAPHTLRLSFLERDARGMAVPVWVRHYGQSGASPKVVPQFPKAGPPAGEHGWARLA